MGQPLNVGGIVQQAAERLQRQRDAARELSQQIAQERAAQASTEAQPAPEGQQ